jgi:hypothetical protein
MSSPTTTSITPLKGQISTREFTGGEVLTRAVHADTGLYLTTVDAPYLRDPALAALIADRGMEPLLAPALMVANS